MKKIIELDRRILNRLQRDIPFVSRPWELIAEELKIDEDFLLKRIDFLKEKGIIRRISAGVNPRKVGFVSTLIAARVAPEKITKVVKKLNLYSEVTHNYGRRDAEFNLWFTLVAKNKSRTACILKQLKKDKDIKKLLNLPAIKLFKIEVNFVF